MAFRFGLATVLRFRESIEKREELALQQVQMQIARARREIDELSAQIAQAQRAREQAMREPLPAAHLQAMVRAAEAAAEQKKALQETLQNLEKLRIQRMQAYQAAHRGRQMLSDIQSRQQDAYERERERRQQKFLDDIFAARLQRD
jgi:flagellar export protein FliJ